MRRLQLGASRVAIADLRGKEFEEAFARLLSGCGNQRRRWKALYREQRNDFGGFDHGIPFGNG